MVVDFKRLYIDKQNKYIKNPNDKLLKQIMKLKEWIDNEKVMGGEINA